MVGSDAEELERRSPAQVAMLRLPWVIITLLVEMGAVFIVSRFDTTLSRVILLAAFMPIISALSAHGAPSGGDGCPWFGDWFTYSLTNGGTCGAANADIADPWSICGTALGLVGVFGWEIPCSDSWSGFRCLCQ